MITDLIRCSRSSRSDLYASTYSFPFQSMADKARKKISWYMPSLGRVPLLILSAVTVIRTLVTPGPEPKSALGSIDWDFLSFYPFKEFVKNCGCEPQHLIGYHFYLNKGYGHKRFRDNRKKNGMVKQSKDIFRTRTKQT